MAEVEVKGLTKRFGKVLAVDDLSFIVHPGQVTGFLGPNGAGKTTTLRVLLGLVTPTAGSATIDGRAYQALQFPARKVGAVLEATGFYPPRSARNHLRTIAMTGGLDAGRVDEVVEMVGLADAAERKVGGFSLGMRQRLGLATALLGDPEVLVLDEPANGLDPQGITWLRGFMRWYASQGRSVLVSSHLLTEISQTVDHVIILGGGRLIAQGSLDEVTHMVRSSVRVRTPAADQFIGVLQAAGLSARREAEDMVMIDGTTAHVVGPLIAQHQIVIYEMSTVGGSLEEAFLALTADAEPSGGAAAMGSWLETPRMPS
jgi:ABC-2 type transport system ATP-binding protein